jgi:uncharacterized membrane protein YkvI
MRRDLSQGKFARILLPAIIFQSVAMGGALATGREIVEYIAQYGSLGVISVITFVASTAVFAIIIYELARMFDAYDYKGLLKNVIWKFWPIFEILYIILATLFIASFLSAGGIIIERFTSLPSFTASAIFVVVIGAILYFGRRAVERFSTIGTVLLYLVFISMTIVILSQRWEQVVNVFTTGNVSYTENPDIITVISQPLIYAGYSLIVFIPVLFSLDRLETRIETFLSAILSAVLIGVLITLSYICILGFYPKESILGAAIPWLAMLERTAGPILVGFYIIALFTTFIETGVGYVHSITVRINENIESSGYRFFAEIDTLSGQQRGLIAGGIILGAYLLSLFGIITIVAIGYAIMGYLLIAVFGIPLLTIGILRIFRPSWQEEFWRVYPGAYPEKSHAPPDES